MLFNSFSFLIFFPIVTILYFLLPHSFRWVFLLVASAIFYMAFIPQYIFILLFAIGIAYGSAILMEKTEGHRRKWVLVSSVILSCGPLFFFKYFNFFNTNLSEVARFLHWNYPIESLSLILPIGISFFTFQSLSYIIEVYRRNQKAEYHLGILALYIMYFPQLVAGPIERPGNLIHQLVQEHSFDAERVLNGLKLMVWGFFKKMVIADKIAIVVEEVYKHPTDFTGVPLIAAALFFGVQVYCDFSGYSDIAIGSAQVMGVRLMENFNRPFHASTIVELWRRWHISLTTWFRDYVYIPLGGNRVGRGRWYFNLFLTFTLSGLWHGAGWGFVLWGSLNGCYLILSHLTRNLRRKWVQWIRLDRLPKLHRGLQVTFTFLLFCFTLIIFRAKSLSDALYAITHLGTGLSSRAGIKMSFERLYSLGLDRYGLLIAVLSIAIMELIYGIEKQSQMRQMFSGKPVWVRWPLYYLLILFLIFFGEYNDHAFIYFQF
jgi:D-alanyl-lipoteichoic acid acyltransferase DltB (MBOAT superfamily)